MHPLLSSSADRLLIPFVCVGGEVLDFVSLPHSSSLPHCVCWCHLSSSLQCDWPFCLTHLSPLSLQVCAAWTWVLVHTQRTHLGQILWESLCQMCNCNPGSLQDTPNYFQAMTREDVEEYIQAMAKEIWQLEEKQTWQIVNQTLIPNDANVLPSTWVFKRKWLPDGTTQKHKARFCVRGYKQVKGINFFETC